MTSTSRPAGAVPIAGAMLVMLAALGLGGCGQTGPLYLPDSGTVVTRPTQSPPSTTPDGAPTAPTAPTTASPSPPPAPPPAPPPKG